MIQVDLVEAEDLLFEAERASAKQRFRPSVEAANAGLSLFVGRPFTGLDAARWNLDRASAVNVRQQLVSVQASGFLALGRPRDAVVPLRYEVASDRLNENLTGSLMRVLWADGRPSEALEVYRQLRTSLAEELGIDPSAALVALFFEILTGKKAPETAAVTGLAHAAPSLPSPVSPLFGRESDLRTAVEAFRAGNRLVTLVGPGGIGKTRLAIDIGRTVGTEGDRPVTFLDLTATRSGSDVTAVAATALHSEQDAITDALVGTRMVLLVDNAEHVLDPAIELVMSFLTVPDTVVLVTSRSPLGLLGEVLIDLDGLAPEPAVKLLAERANYSAEDREAEWANLRKLAVRTDGVPWVLELIAPTLLWDTPTEAFEKLDQILAAAHDASRGPTTRHTSITRVVEWSALQASEAARTALGALTVIRGSFSASTAESIIAAAAQGFAPRLLLTELVTLSLVKRLHAPGPVRFRILEPIRLYATTSPHIPNPTLEVRRSHALYYFHTLAHAHEHTADHPNELEELARSEDANFTQAFTWSLTHDRPLALHHAGLILWGWYILLRHRDVQTFSAELIATNKGAPEERAMIAIMYLISVSDQGPAPEMEFLATLVEAEAPSLDDEWHRRWVLARVQMLRWAERLDDALHMLSTMRTTTSRSRSAASAVRLMILASMGRGKESFRQIELSLDKARSGDSQVARAICLSDAGSLYLINGQHEQAEKYLLEGQSVAAEAQFSHELSCIELKLAWLAVVRDRPRRALEFIEINASSHRVGIDRVSKIEARLIVGLSLAQMGYLQPAKNIAASLLPAIFSRKDMLDPFIVERAEQLREAIAYTDTGASATETTDTHLLEMIRTALSSPE